MPFDASTAKPVGQFDPSTAQPVDQQSDNQPAQAPAQAPGFDPATAKPAAQFDAQSAQPTPPGEAFHRLTGGLIPESAPVVQKGGIGALKEGALSMLPKWVGGTGESILEQMDKIAKETDPEKQKAMRREFAVSLATGFAGGGAAKEALTKPRAETPKADTAPKPPEVPGPDVAPQKTPQPTAKAAAFDPSTAKPVEPKGPGTIKPGAVSPELLRVLGEKEPPQPKTETDPQIKIPGGASDEVQKVFSPSTRTPESRRAAEIIRSNRAERAAEDARADHQVKGFRRSFNALSPEGKWDFVHAYESWHPEETKAPVHANPEVAKFDPVVRKLYADAARRVQSLGKGYLKELRENYIRHYWKDPRAAANVEQQLSGAAAGKRTLKGGGSFLKKRTIDTYKEGMERGLKPAFDDPLDAILTSVQDMNKFYYGEKMKKSLANEGLLKFERGRPDTGWKSINDPAFQSRSPAEFTHHQISGEEKVTDPNQMVSRGQWVAPEPVSRLIDNYLSQGLAGNALYDMARGASNFLNQMSLGLSGFHLIFETGDTIISKAALGLKQAARGEIGKALKTIASSPIAPARTFGKGARLRNAVLEGPKGSNNMGAIVDAFLSGGGRLDMDRVYRSTASRNFYESIKNGTLFKDIIGSFESHPNVPYTGLIRGPLQLAAKAAQTISHPIMQWIVPRMKLGVFYDMAEDWMHAHPNASTAERDAAMTKAWDSVDNRLGQMVYDNLFWNKTAKDLAFLGVRSVGWNLGTIRELGGAPVDTVRALTKLAKGQRGEFTDRMAYAMAMPAITALAGATLMYLMTGKGPQEPIDYYYPLTGRKTPQGQPERLSLPSYMKDVYAYKNDPVGTILNKLSPGISTASELIRNRDYYGGIIHNPNDPTTKQIFDTAKFILGQATPFALKSQQRLEKEKAPIWQQVMSYLGFQPAPQSITDPERAKRMQDRADKPAIRKKVREEAKQ